MILAQIFTTLVLLFAQMPGQMHWPINVSFAVGGYDVKADLIVVIDPQTGDQILPPTGTFAMTGTIKTATLDGPLFVSGNFTLLPPTMNAKIFAAQARSDLKCWTQREGDFLNVFCATLKSGTIFKTRLDIKPLLSLLPDPNKPILDQLWTQALPSQ